MFRPLRRKSNAISDRDAREVLLHGRRGILAVNGDDGYPLALPVNYVFDADANRIYFHGAKAGHKVDSLRRDDRVCFTVIGEDIHVEGEWAPYVRSTVFGDVGVAIIAILNAMRAMRVGGNGAAGR